MFDSLKERFGFVKAIEAPGWFVEGEREADERLKESVMMLPVPDKVRNLMQERGKASYQAIEKALDVMRGRNVRFTRDDLRKAEITQQYGGCLIDMLWARFRYENRENSFGSAAKLHYDAERKLIEIK